MSLTGFATAPTRPRGGSSPGSRPGRLWLARSQHQQRKSPSKDQPSQWRAASGYALRVFPLTLNSARVKFKRRQGNQQAAYSYPQPALKTSAPAPGQYSIGRGGQYSIGADRRDEKGIKKTVCSFLKILHPHGPPTDEEFEEYVAYATECRRRVKEQMNKRKPDDEFARINLSYFKANGEEVVVFCPESKDAMATQHPARRRLGPAQEQPTSVEETQPAAQPRHVIDTATSSAPVPAALEPKSLELKEQHFTILYGDTGYSYESIMGLYLRSAKVVTIEDPYIRLPHQIQNFVRFCETVLKAGAVKKIVLLTSYDDTTPLADMNEKLEQLKQSLVELDVELEINVNPNLHDREIRLDNGWVIKIGRGLDFYQRPGGWFEIGSNDMSLRKCLETKVDIFRI